MLGIVIITHGSLSTGLKDAAEVIIGETNNITTLSLNATDNIEDLSLKISASILEVNQNDGVVLLVDIIGASPYNQSLLAINSLDDVLKKQVCLFGGVNLPMLLEVINHQILETPIGDIKEQIVEQTKNCIGVYNPNKNILNNLEDEF